MEKKNNYASEPNLNLGGGIARPLQIKGDLGCEPSLTSALQRNASECPACSASGEAVTANEYRVGRL